MRGDLELSSDKAAALVRWAASHCRGVEFYAELSPNGKALGIVMRTPVQEEQHVLSLGLFKHRAYLWALRFIRRQARDMRRLAKSVR
jgi:hypothetical protein